MDLIQKTLEETVSKFTEKFKQQKLAATANIEKITEKIETEKDLNQKKKLEDLLKIHVDHKSKLESINPVEEATKAWNSVQSKVNS